jgi:hypothetical protein
MQFEDRGMVIGKGCGTPSMTKASAFPQQAYQMGKQSADDSAMRYKQRAIRGEKQPVSG